MSIWSYLVIPFGYIMRFCYGLFNSYGVALFLYALITRIVLLPLSIHQQKTQLNMLRLKPYQDELMKKYGGNKQKYQEELMNLYQREGYSPMSSCLPTFIQLPVIMLIYTIVRRPLTYLVGWKLTEFGQYVRPIIDNIDKYPAFKGMTMENFTRYELQLFAKLAQDGNEAVTAINTKFLGLFDLTAKPSDVFHGGADWWLLLIPVLAGVTAFLTGWLSQKFSPAMQNADPQSASSTKMMSIFMPLISVWFSYSYVAALGLYWIASNIVAIGQVFLLNKILDPKKVLAEVEDKIRREKEAEKEKKRLAAEKRAQSVNKNSKKKRAMKNAQYAKEQASESVIDTENTEEKE